MTAPLKVAQTESSIDHPPAKVIAANSQPALAPTPTTPLQVLLALEGEALACADRLALKHVAVNKPRALIDAGHILFVTRSGDTFKIQAISSQSSVEKNSPLIQWLTRQLTYAAKTYDLSQPARFGLDVTTADLNYPFAQALYVPFAPNSRSGGLLLTRAAIWEEAHIQIPARLGKIYGAQWTALGRKTRERLTPRKKLWLTASYAFPFRSPL